MRWRTLLVCILFVNVVWADETLVSPKSQNTDQQAQVQAFNQEFSELLMSDQFSDERTFSRWQKIEPNPHDKSSVGDGFAWESFFARLQSFVELASVTLKAILLLLFLVFVWWLISKRQWLKKMPKLTWRQDKAKILPVFYQVSDEGILPDDDNLAQKVRACILAGDYVLALSYLYRGSLRRFGLRYAVPIRPSQTEYQCQVLLQQATIHQADELDFFDELVALWQQAAYGRCLPDNIADRLTCLLDRWQKMHIQSHQRTQ